MGCWACAPAGKQDGAYRQTNVYRQVLEKIQSDYVTEPNINDVTTGALHGLLESLDADSSYLTPAEYKIYKDRPAAGVAQVGITASKRYGYAVVVSVLPGSAADKEHLSDGDVIESIGDQSTREMSVAMIRMMLEGKPGSTLTLSVVRPGKQDPEKVMLTRSIAAVPALDQQQIEGATILYPEAWRADRRASGRDCPRRSRPLRGARCYWTCAIRPAATPIRGCGWRTSLSNRARWPCWKGREFLDRHLLPTRPSLSRPRRWWC